MQARLRILLVTLILLISFTAGGRVRAIGGPSITAVVGSGVSVDGTMQASEWSDATHLSVLWQLSNSSLTSTGDFYVKNDGTNLLVAITAPGSTTLGTSSNTYTYSIALLFNDNNNGTVNNYDAKKMITYSTAGPSWTYSDLHYSTTLGQYVPDTSPNGTAAGSFSNYGGSGTWAWEFSIPMASSNQESFNLGVENTIGFDMIYTETHSLNNGAQIVHDYSYWPQEYTTGGPTGAKPSAQGWADLSRSSSPLADTTPPVIQNPTMQPSAPGANDAVTITAIVTDPDSPVFSVSVYFTTDNWKTVNDTVIASYNTTTRVATAQIPAQAGGSHVQYYLVAFDQSNNRAVNNNNGGQYGYTVGLATSINTSAYIILGGALSAMIVMGFVVAIHANQAKRSARAAAQAEASNA